tara:strand:- start:13260 stop:14456 length:1197 start_codon:yes stop_codon:yes gene_type:complete
MGQVYVIRKEAVAPAVAVPSGVPGMQIMYQPGMENSGPQLVPGVNPQGFAGLQTNPMTQQFEATPQMDNKGNEIGVYEGDKYGAMALNQMNRKKLREGETRALGAGQTAFDRGARYGQFGADFGRGLAGGLGLLAGAVSLANAGASGQDALTGGLGAAQMGSVTYQQGKKPLSEALGGTAARMAGRSVGVVKPEVAEPTPQVADPTPTHSEKEIISMRGKVPVMTTGKHGQPVRYGSGNRYEREIAQRGAEHRLNQQMGRDTSANTVAAEVDEMGMPIQIERKDGMVAIDGGPPGLDIGVNPREEAAAQQARNIKVAPATTNTQPEQTVDQTANEIANATTGQSKLVGVENTANEIKNATQTPEGSDPENPAAKKMSGEEQKMTKLASLNPMRFIGVV